MLHLMTVKSGHFCRLVHILYFCLTVLCYIFVPKVCWKLGVHIVTWQHVMGPLRIGSQWKVTVSHLQSALTAFSPMMPPPPCISTSTSIMVMPLCMYHLWAEVVVSGMSLQEHRANSHRHPQENHTRSPMWWLIQSWKTDDLSLMPQTLGWENPECDPLTTACLAIAADIRRSYFAVAYCEVQGWYLNCTRPKNSAEIIKLSR